MTVLSLIFINGSIEMCMPMPDTIGWWIFQRYRTANRARILNEIIICLPSQPSPARTCIIKRFYDEMKEEINHETAHESSKYFRWRTINDEWVSVSFLYSIVFPRIELKKTALKIIRILFRRKHKFATQKHSRSIRKHYSDAAFIYIDQYICAVVVWSRWCTHIHLCGNV